MSTSKLQRYVSNQLNIHFAQHTIRENIRPDWLIGPDGARLELDFYIEELNIAIEVQGKQHYQYVPYFHPKPDSFAKQIARDEFKKITCDKVEVKLYTPSTRIEVNQIIRIIIQDHQNIEIFEPKQSPLKITKEQNKVLKKIVRLQEFMGNILKAKTKCNPLNSDKLNDLDTHISGLQVKIDKIKHTHYYWF